MYVCGNEWTCDLLTKIFKTSIDIWDVPCYYILDKEKEDFKMLYNINFIKAFNTLEDAKEFCRNRDADINYKDIFIIRKLHFEKKYAVDIIEFETSHDLDQLIDIVENIMCENDRYYYYMYFSRLNIFGTRTMCCIALDESY